MDLPGIATRLAELHESPGYRVHRFDSGPAFAGRVAVLPSAFNPPTRAHLHLIECARTVDGIAHVAALLTTNNVDKSLFGAPLAHRVGMLLHAADEDVPAVLGSNAARLADQGHALRTQFRDTGFDIVVGFDTLTRVFDRKYYNNMETTLDDFFAHHRLIATNRSDAGIDSVFEYLESPIARPYAKYIVPLRIDDEHATLSSTQARTQVANGHETPAALTPEIAEYIRRHGLYGE